MTTKRQAEIDAAVAAAVAAALANAGVAPQPQGDTVASLATIPEAAWESLRNVYANVTDAKGRDSTMRSTLTAFGEQVPSELRGKPIPLSVAEAQAKIVAARLAASYGDLEKLSETERARAKKSVTQLQSRATSLFLCAAIVPQAIQQGFSGGIVEIGKLCTQLKDKKFDLAAVMEARKAEADKPKDYGAFIAQVMSGVLNAKGDIKALSAKAKAELVLWCDNHDIKPKHADEYRNNPLAKS
jgi:hypothetical protein